MDLGLEARRGRPHHHGLDVLHREHHFIREQLRACMAAIGREPAAYGAHSLRIGGATALAFSGVPGEQIQAAGRWHSDAYLRYLRESRSQGLHNLSLVASADTDDNEADFVDVDARGFDDDDDK